MNERIKTIGKINGGLAGLVAAFLMCPSETHAQGDLTPPAGPPRATQKSLQEIWDKMELLDSRVEALGAQVDSLNGQVSDFRAATGAPFVMELVTVGNPGNAPDPGNTSERNVYGAVDYIYLIGKYEVTNAQYVEFLNAIATSADPNACFRPSKKGIFRSGSSGNFAYQVKPWMGDKPVDFVTIRCAMRFCNWLHNGRPEGEQDASTTEEGAYTLIDGLDISIGTDPVHGANGRNVGARFWIPNEDEWYKAAYYSPNVVDGYWRYATQSDEDPVPATANSFGSIANNHVPNVVNYSLLASWNEGVVNTTAVGSAGLSSESFFGASDMSGNVEEWIGELEGDQWVARGGRFSSAGQQISANFRILSSPAFNSNSRGFRVASSQ